MSNSFHRLMERLIDYAGLFPPADLDLDTALTRYDTYLNGIHGWMLGNFIVPCAKLPGVYQDPEFQYGVLVSPTVRPEEIDQLKLCADNIRAIEICFPSDLHSPSQCSEAIHHIETQLARTGLKEAELFIESVHLEAATEAISTFHNTKKNKVISRVGYKLRCGGMKPSAYPSATRAAEVISRCKRLDIPIKFTAGMHQPLRNYSTRHQTMQHGFLNVFAAALLHWVDQLTREDMVQLLEDESFASWTFSDAGMTWKSSFIATDMIDRLRQERVISFGSCSFTEPLEGIDQLGLLKNLRNSKRDAS